MVAWKIWKGQIASLIFNDKKLKKLPRIPRQASESSLVSTSSSEKGTPSAAREVLSGIRNEIFGPLF